MSRRRLLLATADFRRQPDTDVWERFLNRSLDWIQLFPNQWLLWSSNPTQVWFDRVKPIIKEGDHFFIVEIIGGKRAGRMPSATWDFIKKYADPNSGDQQ